MSTKRTPKAPTRPRPRRQPPGVRQWISEAQPERPRLTSDEVVQEALRFIDRAGLQSLTMRALAETLGVYPTAVYWHAGNKGELLNAVANAVLEEVTLPDEGLPWTRWLSEFARGFREAVQRHPNTAPLLGSTLLLTPALLPGLEGVLRRLESIGFGGRELVQAYNAYFGYVVGYTINELSQKPEDVSPDWETLAEAYLGNLSPGSYPTIVGNLQLLKNHAIAFRWISCQDSALLNSYEFGLEALLAGLEQMANGIAEQRASG